MDPRPKTIFCDIDGTLLKHSGDPCSWSGEVLPGVEEALRRWDRRGYQIILVTGRRESERTATEQQLHAAGIFYDRLLMGCGGGVRVLINDRKPDGSETAEVVSLERNKGLEGVDV